MDNKELLSRPALYVLIVIYIIVGFSTLSAGDALAGVLFDEDRYFENIGAIGFFLSSFVFFYGFIKSLKSKPVVDWYVRLQRAIFIGLAFMFFFAGGEEISWGQRIFNIQTPETFAEVNVQGETNIHNISLFEYIIPFETIFDLFWMFLTVILPLLLIYIKSLGEFIGRFISIPRIYVGMLFLFNYLWAKVATVIYQARYDFGGVPFVQAVQEVKESNYAILFILVAIDVIRGLPKR